MAISHSSLCDIVLDVKLKPRIGNPANVDRFATSFAVDGSVGCTRASAAFTFCSVWNMFTFQLKNRLISADPRLVIERRGAVDDRAEARPRIARRQGDPRIRETRPAAQDGNLASGWFDKGEIECPLHAGRFDARTGKATAPPCVDDLKTYPVRVEGGEIEVKLDSC